MLDLFLAYSLMTILKQLSGDSVGGVKFKIADEIPWNIFGLSIF